MDEIIDLSSDSNETIVLPIKKQKLEEIDPDVECLPKTIFTAKGQKYCLDEDSDAEFPSNHSFVPCRKTINIDLSSSSSRDELDELQRLKAKYKKKGGGNLDFKDDTDASTNKKTSNKENFWDDFLPEKNSPPQISEKSLDSTSSSQDELDEMQKLKAKYSKANDLNLNNGAKESRRREKELERLKKNELKEQKKKECEQQKRIKQALLAANKNIKPTECLKFVTVLIDKALTYENIDEVFASLTEAGVEYKTESLMISKTVTWTRKVESHTIDDTGKLVQKTDYEEVDEILLIMNAKDFLEHVSNRSLVANIQLVKTEKAKPHLLIYGLQTYQKLKKHPEEVSQREIEFCLTELQLECSTSHRFIDSAKDLALAVFQFTKAVAQIPFKQRRYEKYQQTDFFASGDNRDCVKVDKNGNGLKRLYNQTLTMFPLARLETAEAIALKFPTVSSLMNGCVNEFFLEDVPVRRAAGPLSTTRKIGPELSKKVYKFYTSSNGEDLL